MGGIIKRELIYIWYYFEVQLSQIFWYWVIGMAVGSLISVFAKDMRLLESLPAGKHGNTLSGRRGSRLYGHRAGGHSGRI